MWHDTDLTSASDASVESERRDEGVPSGANHVELLVPVEKASCGPVAVVRVLIRFAGGTALALLNDGLVATQGRRRRRRVGTHQRLTDNFACKNVENMEGTRIYIYIRISHDDASLENNNNSSLCVRRYINNSPPRLQKHIEHFLWLASH